MAMLISRFNKLIRSRILWGGFLVVIVFTFVIWGMFPGGRSDGESSARSPGKLFGKAVPPAVFYQAYQAILAEWVLAVGRRPEITARVDRAVRRSAWRRLAALEEARRMGLSATDDEVWRSIEAAFSNGGQFNEAAFRDFVDRRLPDLGYSRAFFDQYMRDELRLARLRSMVDSALLIPPDDVQRAFSASRDLFTIEYVELPRSLVEKEVVVADDMLKTEFEKDPEFYRVPAKARVKYVLFKADDFPVEPASIRDDEAEDYYAENAQQFRTLVPDEPAPEASTNGAAQAAAEPRMREKTRPFEDVRGEIRQQLAREASRNRAREAADAFINRILPDREKPMSFEDAAAAAGARVERPEPFAATEPVPGVDLPSFNRAAFELRANPDECFSNPVSAERGVYVIALEERLPSRLPTFEEAAIRIRERVRERMVAETLGAKARELRAAVVEGHRPFADVVAQWGLKAATPPAFTTDDGIPNDPLSSLLARAILRCNAGEMADPAATPDGGLLMARVIQRAPGDAVTMVSLKPDIARYLRREKAPVLQAAFQDWLLQQAKFEPKDREPSETEEGATEKDEPADNEA